MHIKSILHTNNLYTDHLSEINAIKFTRREIDIISCIISGRSAKKIASLLSISAKTVENHTSNIMRKVDCNSKEKIIDFIERSHNFLKIKDYYTLLILRSDFEKTLNHLAFQGEKENLSWTVVYWENNILPGQMIAELATHLKLLNINVTLELRHERQTYKQLFEEISQKSNNIYIFTENFTNEDKIDFEKDKGFPLKIDNHPTSPIYKNIVILADELNYNEISKFVSAFDYISLEKAANYFDLAFQIVQKITPSPQVNALHKKFNEHLAKIPSSHISHSQFTQNKIDQNETFRTKKSSRIIRIIQKFALPKILGLILISSSLLSFIYKHIHQEKNYERINVEKHLVRSDLIIPVDAALLNRDELLQTINNKFHKNKEIQTIALVGIGGAGKTTLARQIAHMQKESVVWEINAESNVTLIASFENLAQHLATTKEEKNILNEIQDIKNTASREQKLFSFIQKKLYSSPNWLLIYDNVDKFTDIIKYYPYEAKVWGYGKVILTTRDSNIQNNKHINAVVFIGELDNEQKLALFMKIMGIEKTSVISKTKIQEAKIFLDKISPFPLDISTAAYYIKATGISYNEYLENMNQGGNDFDEVQENLLKEAGEYTKTRYQIIRLSIQKIINNQKDFQDILLFISLLDSQNIPRDLLNKYKGNLIVDKLIYQLRKYSLIPYSSNQSSIFSIHRSTQKICNTYLIKTMKNEEKKSVLNTIIKNLENYIADVREKDDIPKIKYIVSHAESMLNHKDIFQPKYLTKIRAETGYLHYSLTNYSKSRIFLEENLKIFLTLKDTNSSDVARTLSYLGILDWAEGNYKTSLINLSRSAEIYDKFYAHEHHEYALTLTYLSMVYLDIGNAEEALIPLQKCLKIYQEYLPHDYIGQAFVLAELGGVYLYQGNLITAKNYLEESIHMYTRHSAQNHVKCGWANGTLATYYQRTGEYEKATELYHTNLQIYRENYPENSSFVAWAKRNLGSSYIDKGDLKNGEKLLTESLEVFKNSLGDTNIKTIWVLYELSIAYMKMGKFEQAKNGFEKCLTQYQKHYGKDNLQTAKVFRRLGENYLSIGNVIEAEKNFSKAIEIHKRVKNSYYFVLLEAYADLYSAKAKIAKNHNNNEQYIYYKKLVHYNLSRALESAKQVLPINTPNILKLQNKLKLSENN